MTQGERDILVYEKSLKLRNFLEDFFQQRNYTPQYVTTLKSLVRNLQSDSYELLLVEATLLNEKFREIEIDIPKIALIMENIPRALNAVINYNIDYYLIAPFHEEDLDLKIRIARERKSWFRCLYEARKDLEAVVELTYLITSTLNPRKILYYIVKKISEMIDVTRCSILSIGLGDRRYAYVVSSFEDPSITNIRIDIRKYPEIREALKNKRPVVIQDAMQEPLMRSVQRFIAPIGIKAIAVIPIIYRDEVIGTLFLRTSRTHKGFDERELRLCNIVANIAANVLYNAFLFEKIENEKTRLQKLAITDYLTGIYNIRYFYHRLEEEFSRAQRYGYPLSCIMMDIDLFKNINDRYGHRVGDQVLREFAQLVRRHTRRSDVFARYGGEEFILLLPQTSLDGALKEAERLAQYVKRHSFKILRKERITVSMGVACWPVHPVKDSDGLITLADNALFRAKQMGRDKIVVSERPAK